MAMSWSLAMSVDEPGTCHDKEIREEVKSDTKPSLDGKLTISSYSNHHSTRTDRDDVCLLAISNRQSKYLDVLTH